MIKNIVSSLILGCIMLSACSSSHAEPRYTVTYPATQPTDEGITAYIINYDTGQKIDSALVMNQTATFTGSVTEPVLARLIVNGERRGVFILEPGDISLDSTRMGHGTVLNDLFVRYNEHVDSLQEAFASHPLDSAGIAQRDATYREFITYNDLMLESNIDNPVGYYIFMQQAYEMSPMQLEQALNKMPRMRDYARVQGLVEAAQRAMATAPGQKFTDFAIEYDGKTQRLSDYVGVDGKYTLVDFWASWCGPCIKETRTIKEIYSKYGDRLNVVGVAVWDEPANTLRAIKTHKLPWPSIINAQKIPTDIYGISGIPHIMLIDPDGVIVMRGLQGEELKEAVEAALTDESEE